MKYIILMALALSACSPQTHGQVYNGMTKAQVIQAWGSPCGSCAGTMRTSSGDVWQYKEYIGRMSGSKYKHVFFDREGRVIGWAAQ